VSKVSIQPVSKIEDDETSKSRVFSIKLNNLSKSRASADFKTIKSSYKDRKSMVSLDLRKSH
jgi:hypothetical protein